MKNNYSMLANRIKELRKSKGLTQKQLAAAINISYSSIVDYENGRREPNSKAMAALERYFHVTGEYLRGETENPTQQYIWQDPEIIDAINDTFPNLINDLFRTFLESTELEQKMLFDILLELNHIANLKSDHPKFKAAAFLLMEENFTQTTRFIDFCNRFPTSSKLESNRLEKYKTSCIDNFEASLSKFEKYLTGDL